MFLTRALLLILLLLFTTWGCAGRQPVVIADLERYPQYVQAYLGAGSEARLAGSVEQQRFASEYLDFYFAPWEDGGPHAEYNEEGELVSPFWGIEIALKNPGYGENRLPNDPAWIEHLIAEMDVMHYPSRSAAAITVRETHVRVFPTHKPRFYDFSRAGEGYPFDYWQDSLLFANTPVRIEHMSRTGDWLFVQAPYVRGWVRAQDVALVDEHQRRILRQGPFMVMVRDQVPLYDEVGNYMIHGRVGGLYPVAGDGALLVALRDVHGQAHLEKAPVPAANMAPFPLPLTAQNIARVADAMAAEKYGWGGMYGNRDCSAFLRDIFTSFGVWLPRNSYQQAHFVEENLIDLSAMKPAERERFILENAVPFMTLLWMRGHVMLYIGEHEGQPMAVHDAWGVRTRSWGREGRAIMGGVVITTLRPGRELSSVRSDALLISRIQGMRVLP